MATAYVYFGKQITADTSTALIHICRMLLGEKDEKTGTKLWDTLSINFATGGGDIIGAVAMYNELKGLPASLITNNVGAVDSAAILPFIVGKRRTACAASSFFFHQQSWNFPSNNLQSGQIQEASTWLKQYQTMTAEAVSSRCSLTPNQVVELMRDGTCMSPERALEVGLIHEIAEIALPADFPRHWQV